MICSWTKKRNPEEDGSGGGHLRSGLGESLL